MGPIYLVHGLALCTPNLDLLENPMGVPGWSLQVWFQDGDGDLGEVVIEMKGRDVALFQPSIGRIANLTLRQGGVKGIWFGVDIAQGRLHLRAMRHHESKHRMRRN
jgi:hypothetical protein